MGLVYLHYTKEEWYSKFLSEFRSANKCLVRKPYTSLDLNIDYYTLMLDPNAQKIFTIITPWSKYHYLQLSMGLNFSVDIIQEKTAYLMERLEFACTNLDDLLIICNFTFEEHCSQLTTVPRRLRRARLNIDAEKSFFFAPGIEYIGYMLTKKGVKAVQKISKQHWIYSSHYSQIVDELIGHGAVLQSYV